MSIEAQLHFSGKEFRGKGMTDHGVSVQIGPDKNEARPYELLLMALGSCLYATFMDISGKKRLTMDSVDMNIVGIKRDEIPSFLKEGTVKAVICGAPEKDRTGLIKSFTLATKYCSIYQTLTRVADLEIEVTFE